MYKLTHRTAVIRLADSAFIPTVEGNRDYQKYLEWLSKGNTPEPAAPLPNPRIAEIHRELAEIDVASMRAIRGHIIRGRPADAVKLSKLEDDADALRAELASL